jgi:hypothetical protein
VWRVGEKLSHRLCVKGSPGHPPSLPDSRLTAASSTRPVPSGCGHAPDRAPDTGPHTVLTGEVLAEVTAVSRGREHQRDRHDRVVARALDLRPPGRVKARRLIRAVHPC